MTTRSRRRFFAGLAVVLVAGAGTLFLGNSPLIDRYAGALRARRDLERGSSRYFVVTGVAGGNPLPEDALRLQSHGVHIVRTGCIDLTPDQVAYNAAVAEHFRDGR